MAQITEQEEGQKEEFGRNGQCMPWGYFETAWAECKCVLSSASIACSFSLFSCLYLTDDETEFDVRLSSVARQNADSRRIRGQRSGASLFLHLRAPSSFSSSSSTTTLIEDDEYYKSDALSTLSSHPVWYSDIDRLCS
jgi:hypothetical protein